MGKRPAARLSARKRAVRACAAAVCAAFSAGALAQSALTQAAQASIERAQNTGVFAGLQRSVSTPLEVIWLRTAAEVEAWRSAGFAGATVGRTAWRYIFGSNAQSTPAPNEVARLVVSSLKLPKAPLTTGKLDLAGSGRLFIISPEAPGNTLPASVALVLAAGSTLQVSDAASPSLQIELKAPERRPLLLGNLASADIRRMLALLVRPGAVSASEASVAEGKVALRSSGGIELAALLDGRAQPAAPQVAVAKPRPLDFTQDFAPLASALETSSRLPRPAADFSMNFTAIASAVETAVKSTPAMDFARDFTGLAGVLEASSKLPERAVDFSMDFTAIASAMETGIRRALTTDFASDFSAVVAAVESPLKAPAKPMDFARDFSGLVAAVESPTRLPVREEAPVMAAAAPVAPVETPVPVQAVAAAAAAEPAVAKPAPAVVAEIRAQPVIAIIEADPPPATTAQQAANVARMRAEIEAEIVRDRERLAHQRELAAPARRFVLGV